jgi:hypothetical protein
MITGAHTVVYSKNVSADRKFFRDVLRIPHIDAGGYYLIFNLPPAELSAHEGPKNNAHEFYLICDDVEGLVKQLTKRRVRCSPIQDAGWGLLTHVKLPGGGKLGIYEARYPRPKARRKKRSAPKR